MHNVECQSVSRDAVTVFRDEVQKTSLRGYDRLTSADRWHPGVRDQAEATLAGAWRWKGRPSVSLASPIDWGDICGDDRSWHLALHAWEPLAPVLSMHDRTGDRACLEFALVMAVDWLQTFQSADSESQFAWYDVAVGSRAYRLAYILDVAARDQGRSDELVARLLAGLVTHANVLADDARFAQHSNHALYQIMGQLALARRFPHIEEAGRTDRQARARLKKLLSVQFATDGGHREHSPHYHDLVLIPLRSLRSSGLVGDRQTALTCERAEDGLAWFISPGGYYVMFGDTAAQPVAAGRVSEVDVGSLKCALSRGREGDPPKTRTRGFPDSGYVVFRDRWPTGPAKFADGSHLAQICAFHSRVHKHADDLSFVWHDRGSEILTDAGRFGYVGKTKPDSDLFAEGFWYSDPRRVYVESTRAHNTVEIDGRSNPRRGVEPYGSALTQWGERGEVRFSEARVRWGALSHTRVLLFLPRSWLLVVDRLVDSSGKPHDFRQRFHFAPSLDLTGGGDTGAVVGALPSGDRLQAVALAPQSAIEPVRGQEKPELLGWISRRDGELEPQWTFGWEAIGVPRHTFASLFFFAQETPRVDSAANSISADARTARFTWEADDSSYLIRVERDPGKSLDLDYRASKLPGKARDD